MKYTAIDNLQLLDTKNWDAKSGKKFALQRDKAIIIPETLKEMHVGLGWKSELDLDVAVIMLNQQY